LHKIVLRRGVNYKEFYLPISSGDGIKQKYIKIPNANNTEAGTSIANCKEKMGKVQSKI